MQKSLCFNMFVDNEIILESNQNNFYQIVFPEKKNIFHFCKICAIVSESSNLKPRATSHPVQFYFKFNKKPKSEMFVC